MRYIKAEQIIGTIFINLLNNNKLQITLSELSKINKEIDLELRKNNSCIILLSREEFCTIIDDYSFFILDNDVLKISDIIEKNKEDLIDTLDSFFRAGIPMDIRSTIETVLTKINL